MDVRHLVTKSFDKENDIRQTILLEGVPLNIPINADSPNTLHIRQNLADPQHLLMKLQ